MRDFWGCAQDWIRTSTPFPALPPQGSASTNFATWAGENKLVPRTGLESRKMRHSSVVNFPRTLEKAKRLFRGLHTLRRAAPEPGQKNGCPEQDSNLHTLRRRHLKTVRLPISPFGHSPTNITTNDFIFCERKKIASNIPKSVLPEGKLVTLNPIFWIHLATERS